MSRIKRSIQRIGILILVLAGLIFIGGFDGKVMAADYYLIENGGSCVLDSNIVLAPGTGDFSISVWLTLPASDAAYICGGISQGPTSSFSLSYEATDNFCFAIYYTDGNTVTATFPYTRSDGWKHCVLVCDRDSATGLKMYVNAVQIGDSNDPTPVNTCDIAAVDPYLFNYGTAWHFDDFRFYKTALTELQISTIYFYGAGNKVNEAQFAAIADGFYADCDDGNGSVLSGRICSSGVWSDSNSILWDFYEWTAGGVPFSSSVSMRRKIMYYRMMREQ